jgi:hypothetical protein
MDNRPSFHTQVDFSRTKLRQAIDQKTGVGQRPAGGNRQRRMARATGRAGPSPAKSSHPRLPAPSSSNRGANKAGSHRAATQKQSLQILAQPSAQEPHLAGHVGILRPSTSSPRRIGPGTDPGSSAAPKRQREHAEKMEDHEQIHLLAVYCVMVRLTTCSRYNRKRVVNRLSSNHRCKAGASKDDLDQTFLRFTKRSKRRLSSESLTARRDESTGKIRVGTGPSAYNVEHRNTLWADCNTN